MRGAAGDDIEVWQLVDEPLGDRSGRHHRSGPAGRVTTVAGQHRRHDLGIGPPPALDQREHPFVLEHGPRRDEWRQRSTAAGRHTGRASCRGGRSPGSGGQRA